jgi:hypothetical protein
VVEIGIVGNGDVVMLDDAGFLYEHAPGGTVPCIATAVKQFAVSPNGDIVYRNEVGVYEHVPGSAIDADSEIAGGVSQMAVAGNSLIMLLQGRTLYSWTPEAGLTQLAQQVVELAVGADGAIYVDMAGAPWRYDGNWTYIGPLEKGIPDFPNGGDSLAADAQGNIYVLTFDGYLQRYEGGTNWETLRTDVKSFTVWSDGSVHATANNDEIDRYLGDSATVWTEAPGFLSRVWHGILNTVKDLGAVGLMNIDPTGHLGHAVFGDEFWNRVFAGEVIVGAAAVTIATGGVLAPEGATLTTTIVAGGVGGAAGDVFSQAAYAGYNLLNGGSFSFNWGELGLAFGEGLASGALRYEMTPNSVDSSSSYPRLLGSPQDAYSNAYLMSPTEIAVRLQASSSFWIQNALPGTGTALGQLATNFVVGVGATATAIQGVDASMGFFFNPVSDTLGTFVSTGASTGVNVSANFFIGFVGDGPEITLNSNFSAGPIGVTVFNDPSTGRFLGFTFGVGPSATPGASVTYGQTWMFGSASPSGIQNLSPATIVIGHRW